MLKFQNYLPTGRLWDISLSIANAWLRLNYFPNIQNPRTLNEHILAQKCDFRGDINLARELSDKNLLKFWLVKNSLEELIIPTIAVCRDLNQLRRVRFQTDVVIKPTHSSGKLIVAHFKEGNRIDERHMNTLKNWLQEDYYRRSREPNYFGIERGIMIEELLLDEGKRMPIDFKVFCVDGTPFIIQVDLGRFSVHKRQLYTTEWKLLPYSMAYPVETVPLQQPSVLGKMLKLANLLSAPFHLCRVDFYILKDKDIKLGEITFFPGNGAEKFSPVCGDAYCGDLLKDAAKR